MQVAYHYPYRQSHNHLLFCLCAFDIFVAFFSTNRLGQCFYSLLSLAFQVPFNRLYALSMSWVRWTLTKGFSSYGSAGFVIYWMMSWTAMCALGGAVESMITILTPQFIPFFLLLWIIGASSCYLYPGLSSPVFSDLYAFNFRSECFCVCLSNSAACIGVSVWLCYAVLQCPTNHSNHRFRHS